MTAAPRMPHRADPIPRSAGIGLRAPHFREILEAHPEVGWLEVHSENFFCAGGQAHWFLERLRERYPLSLHGVGLGLGSVDPLSEKHLDALAHLVARYEPALVSEHVCWSAAGGRHFNDLLPLPYTDEALGHLCRRIEAVQERLGRQILIENVSSYLQFAHSTIPEWEFVAEAARRSGCGILLDINNVYVNAINHAFAPSEYLSAIPANAVQEIHLAGFDEADGVLIDTHGKAVYPQVWSLFESTIARLGPRPVLIEWDTDIPPLHVLLNEATTAQLILEREHVAAG